MRREVFIVAAALVIATGQVSAQVAGSGADSRPQQAVDGVPRAPVTVDGETLFLVRGVTAFPAEQRATEIAGRIMTLAADPELAPPAFTLDEQPGLTWILINGRRLMAVFDDDAAVEGVARSVMAEAFATRVVGAIGAYRAARDPARLGQNALLALLATGGLLVALFACRLMVRGLRRFVERRYRARVRDLSIQSFHVINADSLWRAASGLVTLIGAATVVALLFVYLEYVLALFPWTRATGRQLGEIALAPPRRMGLGLLAMFPNLVFLTVLFVITRWFLKLVRLFFESVGSGIVKLKNFDADWAAPTYRLVRLLIVALALVVAYPYVPGSETDAFKGISLFVGVVFSLGSSSLIGNLIAGSSMTYRRAFRVGDRVKIGEHTGEVMEMRLLVTHLRTIKNEEVIVPNSSIVNTDVVNFSSMAKERGLILHTTVGIGYETPWRQVEAMLLEAAARTPGLIRDQRPFVHQLSLGDFCITYEINVFCDAPDRMRLLYTELHRNILDVFNEYGVQIMTPAYEGDPDQPKIVPPEHWHSAPAAEPPARAGSAVRESASAAPPAVR
jgi:small-conductance mechanosensitive channel